MVKQSEEAVLKKEIQDYNRDIGKHFEVRYSPTTEAKKEVRVRSEVSLNSTDFTLSETRLALFNYLFARSQTNSKIVLSVNDRRGDMAEKLGMLKWLGL